jgi:PPOX class probable F420-dependent enzyme
MAFDPALLALFAELRGGSLITLKRDGRPQASVVIHVWDPDRRAVRISVTDDRAKTRNLRRDPRASYQVVSPDLTGWAVGEGYAELTAPATDPHDATVDALVDLYRTLAGEHPDWDGYRAAMVADRRVVLTVAFERVYGGIQGR